MAVDFITVGITTTTPWTSPQEEARAIEKLLGTEDHGDPEIRPIDFIHIRKTEASEVYTLSLISSLQESLHRRLILHSHFQLYDRFDLGGIHWKVHSDSTVKTIRRKRGSDCLITRSCHSLTEVHEGRHEFHYSFLSPIFDSISKFGYSSRFSLESEELLKCTSSQRIVALGGVKPEFFQKLYNAKFAGAALLGYLWSPKSSTEEISDSLIKAKIKIK